MFSSFPREISLISLALRRVSFIPSPLAGESPHYFPSPLAGEGGALAPGEGYKFSPFQGRKSHKFNTLSCRHAAAFSPLKGEKYINKITTPPARARNIWMFFFIISSEPISLFLHPCGESLLSPRPCGRLPPCFPRPPCGVSPHYFPSPLAGEGGALASGEGYNEGYGVICYTFVTFSADLQKTVVHLQTLC